MKYYNAPVRIINGKRQINTPNKEKQDDKYP